MSEIFLDTETTGLSFEKGHKIVEIACIETKDLIATGKVFHELINPKRDVPEDAFKVHGFSQKFLSDKKSFEDVSDDFLNFVNGKIIVSKDEIIYIIDKNNQSKFEYKLDLNKDEEIISIFETNEDIHYLTNNPQRRCPDISKAKNKLNFSPNISLEEGLGYTYKYYSDRINEN